MRRGERRLVDGDRLRPPSLPQGAATQISALLDTTRFPGKRALPKDPRHTLELALLADGVPPENVYSELATPEGADRAFAALDKIKDDVLLWSKAKQPITWLLEKKVVMAAGYSGRIFRAAVGDHHIGDPVGRPDLRHRCLGHPQGCEEQRGRHALHQLRHVAARLAAQAQLIAYGPMRKSAVGLVGKHPVINVEMQEFLPTAPDNFKKALKFDDAWWTRMVRR